VLRDGPDPRDVGAVDGIAHEFPHCSVGARGLALIGDLIGGRGSGLDGPARRLHDRAHRGRDPLQVIGNGNLIGGGHRLGLYLFSTRYLTWVTAGEATTSTGRRMGSPTFSSSRSPAPRTTGTM